MLSVIVLESIAFGLLGYAILLVGTKMDEGYDRTSIIWLLSIVLALLGAKLGWDLVIDGSHAIDSRSFSAVLAGLVVIAGSSVGITSFFVMLNGQRSTASSTNG
jgi:hypothetical protein